MGASQRASVICRFSPVRSSRSRGRSRKEKDAMQRKFLSQAILALASLFLLLAVALSPAAAKGGPDALTLSPDGARLYLAWTVIDSGHSASALSVIDAATLQVAATFSL